MGLLQNYYMFWYLGPETLELFNLIKALRNLVPCVSDCLYLLRVHHGGQSYLLLGAKEPRLGTMGQVPFPSGKSCRWLGLRLRVSSLLFSHPG